MRKGLTVLIVSAVMVGVGLVGNAEESDAAFHFMRVYGVMGGAFGDANIQYVELRMTTGGQNLVGGHDICFYDATGAPYARFRFAADAPNGAGTASIMVGSSEFDAVWAVGSPDYFFNGATVTQIAAGADVNHPIRQPAGKVAFGTDGATMPAAMCQANFGAVDAVAYGTGYTGNVNFPPKFNTDMPTAGTSAVRLTGTLCTFCTFNNSSDYSLLDVNVTANNPRNNANQSGALTNPDSDGDGVPNASDNCPDWENPLQDLPPWTLPPGDTDCDGYHATNVFTPRAGEADIGTVPTKHCNATPTISDEPLANDAWPPDFNDNQLVNGADILHYNAAFGQPTTNPPVSVGGTLIPLTRFDLNNSELVNGADILQLNPFFGKRCKPL